MKQFLFQSRTRLYLLVQMLPTKTVSMEDLHETYDSTDGFSTVDDPNVPPNYRPWIMRSVTLVILGLLPLVVLGITEYLFQCSVKGIGLFKPDGSARRLVFRNFVSQFFSLLVLILGGLFYQDLDFAVKTMEPFYHLSTVNGADGDRTLLIDYVSPIIYFTPFQAAYYSQWAVFCSSLANIISTNALPTLALGVFGVTEEEAPMDPTFTRGLEAMCGFITLLTLLLWVILVRRRSGLLSFPDSLLAYIELSSGLDHDNSLHELFKPLTQRNDIDEKILSTTLDQRRFRLLRREANLKSPLDIVLVGGETPPSKMGTVMKNLGKPFQTLAILWQKSWGIRPGHPDLFQTRPLTFLMSVLLGLFIIADGQIFWAQSSRFFTFVGEKRFARSSVSTLIQSIIWAPIRKNASLMEPFYRLKRPDGVSKNVLSWKVEWPFQDLIHSIRSVRNTKKKRVKDYCMAFIMVGVYASNLFVVAWNTLALNAETTGPGFWISYGLQLGCEVLMATALVAIFIWRRTPIIPILPLTIASNLFYVYATNLQAGRFQDFQQRIDTPTLSHTSETLGEGREKTSELTSEKIVIDFPKDDAGESQTKPPEFAVIELEAITGDQVEQLSEAVPDPRIETSECLNNTKLASVDQDPALALETADKPDSTTPTDSKTKIDLPTKDKGTRGSDYPASEAKEIDVDSVPENESKIMCGFGYFKGRDQQMHLGVGRFSSIEAKYIAMNRKNETAVWDILLSRWSKVMF